MSTHKIVDIEQLVPHLEGLKTEGKKIVTTNGCFDILHVGHIRYLEQARMLGDVLVVGLNTDESVKMNKGPKRPLNSEIERAEALAALSCVDYVVLFSKKTPEDLLERIKPHIHTKGGDYVISQIPERHVVAKHGGETILIAPTEGVSTTKLIERIIEVYKNS